MHLLNKRGKHLHILFLLAAPATTLKTRKHATPESEDSIDDVPETHHTSAAVRGVPKDVPVVEVELQRALGTLPQVPVVAVDSASPPRKVCKVARHTARGQVSVYAISRR